MRRVVSAFFPCWHISSPLLFFFWRKRQLGMDATSTHLGQSCQTDRFFGKSQFFRLPSFFCECVFLLCKEEREWSPFLESQSNHNLMNHFLQIRQFSRYTKPYLTALFSCRQKNQPKGCSEALAQKSWRLVLVDSLRLLFLQAFSWGGPLMDTAFSAFVRKQKASFLQFLHFFAVAARLATTNEGKKRGGGRSYSTPIALVEWTTI